MLCSLVQQSVLGLVRWGRSACRVWDCVTRKEVNKFLKIPWSLIFRLLDADKGTAQFGEWQNRCTLIIVFAAPFHDGWVDKNTPLDCRY